MELHQLRCFVAVAEELHFGRAAARLHMTQPPLSRQLQLLEHKLGVLLLERNNRQARLTPAGQSFLEDARHILQIADQATQSARRIAHGEAGRLTLGFTAVDAYNVIPQLLLHAAGQMPDVDLILQEQVSSEQVHALEVGLIDVGFVRQVIPVANVVYSLLTTEKFVAAVPLSHHLAGREKLRPADFHGEPFLTYSFNRGRYFHDKIATLFAAASVSPNYLHQLSQTHSILGLVNVGVGCALVPASAKVLRMKAIQFIDFESDHFDAEIFLAHRVDSTNPVLGAFLSMTRQFFSQDSA